MHRLANIRERIEEQNSVPRELLVSKGRVIVLDRMGSGSSTAREIAVATSTSGELWADGQNDGFRSDLWATLLVDKLLDDHGVAVAWFDEHIDGDSPGMPLRLLTDAQLRIDDPGGRAKIAQLAQNYGYPTTPLLILNPLPMFLRPGASDQAVAEALQALNEDAEHALLILVQPFRVEAEEGLPGWVLETDWEVVWSPSPTPGSVQALAVS